MASSCRQFSGDLGGDWRSFHGKLIFAARMKKMRQRPRYSVPEMGDSSQGPGSQREAYGCGSRRWVEMAPDVLANIFARLPFDERLTVIPCVCKPWNIASLDPLCWQVLDLHDLNFTITPRLLQVLLQRSQGRLLEFLCPQMNLDCLELLAHSAPLIQKLHIPWGETSNKWAINAAPLMPCITDLDLSGIKDSPLSHETLEAFGKHCKHIIHLRMSDHRVQSYHLFKNSAKDDPEAFAIAQYFPSLTHLELQNNRLSTQGLRAILNGCPMLDHLDLTACVMDMDEALLNECLTRLRVFVRPYVCGEDDANDDDDEEEDSSDCDYERCCMKCGFPDRRYHLYGWSCHCFRCCSGECLSPDLSDDDENGDGDGHDHDDYDDGNNSDDESDEEEEDDDADEDDNDNSEIKNEGCGIESLS